MNCRCMLQAKKHEPKLEKNPLTISPGEDVKRSYKKGSEAMRDGITTTSPAFLAATGRSYTTAGSQGQWL